MQTDQQAFLDAVRADPLNDLPRLVYADWLEEHGQPDRAEFIRIQCRLYDMEPDHPVRIDLEEQAWELGLGREAAWAREWPTIGGVEWQGFERGFPAWAQIRRTQTGVLEPIAAVLEQSPVRKLRLQFSFQFIPLVEELLRLPKIEQLTGLDIQIVGWTDFQQGEQILGPLTRCERLHQLREFHWRDYQPLAAEQIRAFANAGQFRNLRHLAFSGFPLEGPAHLHTLARGTALRGLQSFTMCTYFGIPLDPWIELYSFIPGFDGDGYLEALARGAHWEQLHTLQLRSMPIRQAGVAALLAGKFPGLRALALPAASLGQSVRQLIEELPWPLDQLNLSGSHPGIQGVRAFTRSPMLKQLRELHLNHCSLGPQAGQALGRAGTLEQLRRLHLRCNPMHLKGLRAVTQPAAMPELMHLNINLPEYPPSRLKTDELRQVFQHLNLPKLRHLDLSHHGIWVRGAKDLAANPSLAHLRELILEHTHLRGSALEPLLGSPYLQGLRRLDLSRNNIGDEIAPLTKADCLPKLAELRVCGNRFRKGLKTRLRKRFGKLNF